VLASSQKCDLPGADGRQRSIGDIGGRVSEITTHIDPSHYSGHRREENSKYSEPARTLRENINQSLHPCDTNQNTHVRVIGGSVSAQVSGEPAVEAVGGVGVHKRADGKVEPGHQQDQQQHKLQFHHPLDAGNVDDAQGEHGGTSETSLGPRRVQAGQAGHRLAKTGHVQCAAHSLK
jgi:hypothetical protein